MRSMRGAVQGRDTSVRGIICKGRFVQGPQHPRTFGRGHIGRGHINPASMKAPRRVRGYHDDVSPNNMSPPKKYRNFRPSKMRQLDDAALGYCASKMTHLP
jgi:hypothetical protein